MGSGYGFISAEVRFRVVGQPRDGLFFVIGDAIKAHSLLRNCPSGSSQPVKHTILLLERVEGKHFRIQIRRIRHPVKGDVLVAKGVMGRESSTMEYADESTLLIGVGKHS